MHKYPSTPGRSGFSNALFNHVEFNTHKTQVNTPALGFISMQLFTDSQFISHIHTHTDSHTHAIKAALCQEKSEAPHCNHCSTLRLKLTSEMTENLGYSVQKGLATILIGRCGYHLSLFSCPSFI